MVEEVTAEQESPVPSTGQKRARSTIQFPYGDLNDALEVARAIHQNAGDQCGLDQLAAWLHHDTVHSGAFRGKVNTARIFGLIEPSRNRVSLTTLGQHIVDPQRERQARLDAFLGVPLYSAIFDRYRGRMLPPDVGLEREMVTLGVSEKQGDKARQAFQRSADQAGFFAHGRDRLVMPAGTSQEQEVPGPDQWQPQTVTGAPEPRRGMGEGGPPSGLHPFIQGLLGTLPDPDSVWPLDQRKKWLETAENIFSLIYKDTPVKHVSAEPKKPEQA